MNAGNQYVKIVEWSNEDQCFVGSCPGLFYGGCHGDDEKAVFAELCEIVDETISLYLQEGTPLPETHLWERLFQHDPEDASAILRRISTAIASRCMPAALIGTVPRAASLAAHSRLLVSQFLQPAEKGGALGNRVSHAFSVSKGRRFHPAHVCESAQQIPLHLANGSCPIGRNRPR